VQEGSAEKTEQRHPGSRVLHALDRWAARPTLALGVVTAVVVWVLFSAVFGFPARLETVFQTLAAATTLAMVFVINTHSLVHRQPPSANSMRSFELHRKLTTR
jgi:low affinity Fe/Cu permease